MVNFWAVRRSIAATRLGHFRQELHHHPAATFFHRQCRVLVGSAPLYPSLRSKQGPDSAPKWWDPWLRTCILLLSPLQGGGVWHEVATAFAASCVWSSMCNIGGWHPKTWPWLPAEAPQCNRSNEMHLGGALRRESTAPCDLCGFFSPDGSRRLGKSFDGSRLVESHEIEGEQQDGPARWILSRVTSERRVKR